MISKEVKAEPKKKGTNNISQESVLEYLYLCIPDSLADKPYKFFANRREIEIGRHLYRYYVRSNGEPLIIERKVRGNEPYDLLLTPKRKNNKTMKLHSKSGKINKEKPKSGMKIMLSFAAATLMLSVAASYLSKQSSSKESAEIIEEHQEQFIEVPIETLAQKTILEEPIQEEIQKELENAPKTYEIEIPLEITPVDYLGRQKCLRTEEIYGEFISYYARRRGLDENLLISLFTRERFSEQDKVPQSLLEDIGYELFDKNDVDVEAKMKENIGQLTRAICGEEIVAPVFLNGEVVGYDKIFVLPPSFDSYEITDLKELSESQEFSAEDSRKLKRAYELSQTGEWKILKRIDVFYNAIENINVSTAYLSYLINKKQDLIKGVMSYNAGYGSVPDNLSYEEILKGEVQAFDPLYIINILQYAPFENGIFSCTIQYQTGETVTYKFQNTKELGVEYEKENGLSL